MTQKKYLITGGAGFIGSHLSRLLLSLNHDVVILDDLSTGKLSNIPEGCDFIEASANDKTTTDKIIQNVDGVFHLAAIASVEKSTNEWYASTKCNLLATVNILESIKDSGKHIPFVFASSAAIYGDNSNCPLNETMPSYPLSSYGIDKYSSEQHARIAGHIHNIPTAALRFFNVYGERQDPNSPYSGVISIFVNRALNEQEIVINGDGGQSRDFIYVGDICAMLYAAINKLHSQTKAGHLCFNACTGKATTIKELANLIKQITNSSSEIIFNPPRIGDIYKSFGNADLIESELDIKAQISLIDGLTKTINWLKQTSSSNN
jgi:UDP-glucose 4-epimerase